MLRTRAYMHVTSACMQISLPVDTASGMCFLECYIQNILALQRRSGAKRPLQLAIMTSDDTHEATQKLLEAGGHFGARASSSRGACHASSTLQATLRSTRMTPTCSR
jgi:hypothetical protein